MKVRNAIPILLTLVSFVLLSCASGILLGPTPTSTQLPPTPTPQPGIKGKIYRSDTDQPILNVTVSLVNPSLDKKDPAYTIAEIKVDEQGQFGFNNLKPGEYELDILEEELSEDALPCIDSGSVTFDQSGKTVKETFAYTENDKFYLLQIIPSVTVSVGNMTENDVDMYCSNW